MHPHVNYDQTALFNWPAPDSRGTDLVHGELPCNASNENLVYEHQLVRYSCATYVLICSSFSKLSVVYAG